MPIPPKGTRRLRIREPTGYELMKAVEGVINSSNPWGVTIRLEYNVDNSKMMQTPNQEWVVPMLPRKSVVMHCDQEDHVAAQFFPIKHMLASTFNADSAEEWKHVASFFLHMLSKERLRTYLRREEKKKVQETDPVFEANRFQLHQEATSHLKAVTSKVENVEKFIQGLANPENLSKIRAKRFKLEKTNSLPSNAPKTKGGSSLNRVGSAAIQFINKSQTTAFNTTNKTGSTGCPIAQKSCIAMAANSAGMYHNGYFPLRFSLTL